jgi:hypothetical protein
VTLQFDTGPIGSFDRPTSLGHRTVTSFMFLLRVAFMIGEEMSTVRSFIYRFLTKRQSAEIATVSATISFKYPCSARICPNDIPSLAEVEWLFFFLGVNMGARVRNLPWFNDLRALQPICNWVHISAMSSSWEY